MEVITVANQKGGCGKTITAINLASCIASMNKRVLLIDLDPQSHATLALGIKIEDPSRSSYAVFEALINRNTLNLSRIIQKKYDNLWVIGSHISLSTMEQKMAGVKDAVQLLSSALLATEAENFDYIVIDTPPSLGFLTLNAIVMANRLIVPLDVSLFSMNGVDHINEILKISESMGFKKPIVNYLITLYDGRTNFAKNFLENAKQELGDRLLHTVIRPNIKIRESVLQGKSIFEYSYQANGSKDYLDLALEIAPGLKAEKTLSLKTLSKDTPKRQALFRVYAPEANEVHIAGTFNGWVTDEEYLMKKLDNGMWIKLLNLPEGTYHYKFVVDNQWIEDPNNSLVENDKLGGRNSVLLVKA